MRLLSPLRLNIKFQKNQNIAGVKFANYMQNWRRYLKMATLLAEVFTVIYTITVEICCKALNM